MLPERIALSFPVLQVKILSLVVVVVALLSQRGVECRKAKILNSFEYNALSCRAHSASITDFGGVGDGKTSNTKAFHDAINQLSQHAGDGGAQLYVPAGKWLTGSFSLISHFTLYLHKDAVLLASQVHFTSVLISFPSSPSETEITNKIIIHGFRI